MLWSGLELDLPQVNSAACGKEAWTRCSGSRGAGAGRGEPKISSARSASGILDTDKGALLMEQCFKRINSLAKSPKLLLRIRFMLRDVMELWRDRGVSRKATSTEGPMPINQIRNDNNEHSSPGGPLGGGPGGPCGYDYGRNCGEPDDEPSSWALISIASVDVCVSIARRRSVIVRGGELLLQPRRENHWRV
ncbi:uncharacterized protein LOC116416731 [Nasonia vitripennis]|uniref:Uncharacterized protein n=1 Tax=Nasonia vitripennis TaxID=7425 RepID=A0A7M7T897_NASVI|nr:uncharacterized protein LOC116416731 [Nasonia vitripennis]